MTTEKALHDLFKEVQPKEYLELLRLLNNCYLETADGGVNMDVIYRIQCLEDFFSLAKQEGSLSNTNLQTDLL